MKKRVISAMLSATTLFGQLPITAMEFDDIDAFVFDDFGADLEADWEADLYADELIFEVFEESTDEMYESYIDDNDSYDAYEDFYEDTYIEDFYEDAYTEDSYDSAYTEDSYDDTYTENSDDNTYIENSATQKDDEDEFSGGAYNPFTDEFEVYLPTVVDPDTGIHSAVSIEEVIDTPPVAVTVDRSKFDALENAINEALNISDDYMVTDIAKMHIPSGIKFIATAGMNTFNAAIRTAQAALSAAEAKLNDPLTVPTAGDGLELATTALVTHR
ncbi:hypothetical protein [Candidatus Epulonipiscium viviparus]|uniref:hypothetical protein n=1 Tax=Candidatus Epulonipiscium viviparus TaxID=420336 RepID=UPI0027380A92|nr:hypothetical protein [Candidatus Epulopiscium viviparus]